MNKRIALFLTVILSMTLFWGCQKKEEIPVVTEQPVLGEDVVGYIGFTHLQAYTMTGEDGTVVYLPISESAYVGGTCVISETQGVEVTVNQDPMLADNVAAKGVKQKLNALLDGTYSNALTKNMLELERSGVTELDNGGAFVEVTYLIYDDDNKQYVSYWVGNYYIILEDGREFQVEIRVNSGAKTGETQNVVAELAKYLDITLPYDETAMQAKIDGYSMDDNELARLNGDTVPMGSVRFYMPEGWKENAIISFKKQFASAMGDVDDMVMYSEDAAEKDPDKFVLIMQVSTDDGSIGAWYNSLSYEFQRQSVAEYFEEVFKDSYAASSVDVSLVGIGEHGYVFKIVLLNSRGEEGIVDQKKRFDRCVYFIIKADVAYQIESDIVAGASEDEKQEVFDMVERVYSSMESK